MPGVVRAHEQVAAHYRQRMRRGGLKAGQRLPSVREIARAWSVSTRTAWRAVTLLRDEGWIEHRQGRQPVVVGRGSPSPAARSVGPRSGDSLLGGLAGPRPHYQPADAADPEGRWLAERRREIIAIAREALRYRELGNPAAVEGLDEIDGEVGAGVLTPGVFAILHLALADLHASPLVRIAGPDHAVHALLDRWSVLFAQHPAQQR